MKASAQLKTCVVNYNETFQVSSAVILSVGRKLYGQVD